MSYGRKTKKALYRMYDKHCAYCGASLRASELTLDHVYPKCKGGVVKYSNIKPSCSFCNNFKGSDTIRQFKEHILDAITTGKDVGRKCRNKYDISNGKVTFYFEKVHSEAGDWRQRMDDAFRQIRAERECSYES